MPLITERKRVLMPSVAYANIEATAIAVQRWVNGHDVPAHFTARPWNRFDPVNGEWYLVPSTDWPAYAHSKFSFQQGVGNQQLYCAFYAEKGLSQNLKSAYPNAAKLFMTRDWAWAKVLRDMAAGALDEAAKRVMQLTNLPVHLRIDWGYVQDPGSYDPLGPQPDWQVLDFAYEATGLRLERKEPRDLSLPIIEQCSDLSRVAEAIPGLEAVDWMWVNLHLGVDLEMVPLDPDQQTPRIAAWDAADIWRRCMVAWNRWVL